MLRFVGALCLVLAALSVQAAEKHTMCVFDVIGANGDSFNLMKDYALQARADGVEIDLRPYTDENVALGDFLSGQCDILAATDLRTRRFNRFTGTISAVGALPTYQELKTVIMALSRPKAAPYMDSNGYEVLGILPLGAGYLFVDDKNINTAGKLAGKKIATLDYQKDAIHMVNFVKASVVPSDITNFASKFNNGMVDACYAPAYAYKALELYKGVDDKGGVVKYPLAQLTMQLIAKDNTFSKDFAQKSREIAAGLYDKAMNVIQTHEKDIPADKWIDISKKDIEGYQEMFRQNRIQLRDGVDSEGHKVAKVYSAKMLHLLWKVRCKYNPGSSECTASDHE